MKYFNIEKRSLFGSECSDRVFLGGLLRGNESSDQGQYHAEQYQNNCADNRKLCVDAGGTRHRMNDGIAGNEQQQGKKVYFQFILNCIINTKECEVLHLFQIMVVEDDKNTRRLMKAILKHDGYEVFTAENGMEALDLMDSQHIDLIVLDVMMPKMDGYEFTERMREGGDMTPILMVTAKQLPEERCKGFLVGTDDYMVKPVNEDEMLLRIKALLRRSRIASERKLHIGKMTLDYDALTVSRNGVSQTLPQKEFYLLYKLLSYPDKIFTRFYISIAVFIVS